MRPAGKIIVLAAMAWASLGRPCHAQEPTLADLLADPAVELSRPDDRARVVARLAGIENTRRTNAHARAAQLRLPLRTVFANGRIQELADFDAQGQPLYLATDNANAAISTGANLLRTSPYALNGSGVIIGVWDGGAARTTHQELTGRVTVKDGAAVADHATHVGGTLIATGINAAAHGMANAATVDSYEWTNDTSEMTSRGATAPAQTGKIYLSNHSYGYVAGWNNVNYTGTPTRLWEWNGSGTAATSIEDDFGRYNTYARTSDSLAFSAPYYLIFRSAGNERGDNPAAGESVALSPGSSTVVAYNPATHPVGDANYRGGFETIAFDALGKNVITIGSVADAVSNGTRNPAQASISSFSSWGPTDDGRIKPDIVANGEYLYSSLGGSDSAYDYYSGTSMATPNACGSAALLIQYYSALFPAGAMRSSTLKGLLIHTADDRGNAGPDYKFGWGLINVKAAADLLKDHQAFSAKQRLTENQLTTTTTTRTISFVWDGASPITATLCWTDPAGTATTSSDSRTRRLVNDLNLKLIAPGGSVYSPFVMPFVGTWTQAAMDLPATTGVNTTDNVEQVRLAAPPAAGTYQAVVSFTGTLTNSSQYYSLLLTGASAEPPPPPPLALATVAPASGLSSGATTLTLTGTGLRADTTVKLTRAGQADLVATGVQLVGENLTCAVNLTGAAAGAWNVVATNPNSETSTLVAAFTVVGAIWAENFDGTVTGWSSVTTNGTNSWTRSTAKSKTPTASYFAPGPSRTSTVYLTSPSIAIPAGATNLQLKFWHNYNLSSAKDGGRLEFSIDSGAWFDVVATGSGAAFASNGYVGTISSTSSDFPNMKVWTGNSGAFIETIVNLTDAAKYAGKNFRARWGLATNNSTASTGWYVDSIALIGGGNLTNQAPVVVTAATSASTETVTDPDTTVYQIIRSDTTQLSVTATDDAGEAALTYTWAVLSGPASPVGFSANGTNAAKTTVIDFSSTGDYQLGVTIRDAQGLAGTSAVNLRVVQTATGLIVNPIAVTLPVGTTQAFIATVNDQFSSPMASQPLAVVWTASGGGAIEDSGVFAATTTGGPHTITASAEGFSNTATATVTPGLATVTLSDLTQTYDGKPRPATITTTPSDLAVTVTYDGAAEVPTAAGSYAVVATVTNPNYQGNAAGTLLIEKATATVTLENLTQTYDGTPKPATVTLTPTYLAASVTYAGSAEVPTAVGNYAVVATVADPNYQGSQTGELVIAPANDWASWCAKHFSETEIAAGLSGDTVDADADGLPNLAEFALGTDPRHFTPPLVAVLDSNGLSLTFTRPANLPGLIYFAEATVDFGAWTPVPLEVLEQGPIETLRARDSLTNGDPTRRFLRLRFQRQ
jgi:hypothetical protein